MKLTITAKIQYEPGEEELTPAALARQFTVAARAILRNRARIEPEAARAIEGAPPPKRHTHRIKAIDSLKAKASA